MTSTELLKEVDNRVEKINDPKKKEIINDILSKPNWYKFVSLKTAVGILTSLGYNKEEAIEIYKAII